MGAVIAFFLQDLDGGGAERAIIRLAGEIAERGYSVDLVVGDASSEYRAEVSSQVNLIDFSTRSLLAIFFRLKSYLRSKKPTAVMSALDPPNILLILAARHSGFKGRVIISQRAVVDASLRDLNGIRRTLTRLLMSFCFPQADGLISNSCAAARELEKRFNIPAQKIFTIHNAINVTRINQLAREPLSNRFIIDGHIPTVISVGSLTKRKDMATLIRAFALVRTKRQVRLVIVGKGPEKDALMSLIESLGLSKWVHLTGFEVNPYKWIAAASVFVSSSTEEGFPNVIAEAMALGCPVVATDCPGDTAVLLEHGRWGRLVPVGDAERMSEAILSTLEDADLPDVSVRVADFSPSKNASAYLEVLLPKNQDIFASKEVV